MNASTTGLALALAAGLLLSNPAAAFVDEACADVAAAGTPEGYSEQGQQDFLLNYFAMATTFSPLHKPLPHQPGHGSIGLELAIIPPLSCERRLVLDYTKTEDTNKAPVAPRPRITFAFPQVGKVVPYAGLGYVPPVTVFGTRNVIVSVEAGLAVPTEGAAEFGVRYHATLLKTVAEIATPFVEGEEAYDDFYVGSTFGLDLMAGYRTGPVTPYLAAGFTDASTFFYIGDDAVVSNNLDPYFGFTGSLGVQGTIKDKVSLAGELYAAPGAIYTGRLRASWVF
jgi:hypothetical protein